MITLPYRKVNWSTYTFCKNKLNEKKQLKNINVVAFME